MVSKKVKKALVFTSLLGCFLTSCEKDQDLIIDKNNYSNGNIQGSGPSRIDQTPIRINIKNESEVRQTPKNDFGDKNSSVLSMEHETKKGIIQNIR